MRKYYDIVQCEEARKHEKKLGFEKMLLASELRLKKGGSLEANRKAVRTKTDVLLDPVSPTGLFFDTAVAQVAKDNNVVIAFSLNSLLSLKGVQRVKMLANMQKALGICLKMKNEVMVISHAEDEYGARDALSLVGLGVLLGLSKPQALWVVSNVYEGLV